MATNKKPKRLLRKFGDPDDDRSYDLSHCISGLEALCREEEDTPMSPNGPKTKRLDKVQDAIQLLYEAAETGRDG